MEPVPVMGLVEVAQRLGVSKSRARQLADGKDFPHGYRLSVGWVWMTADVEAWIAKRRPDNAGPASAT
jgi:prophage regulatory protein